MNREQMIEAARLGEFNREISCCGIDDKFCENDIWKGNISCILIIAYRMGATAEREECAKIVDEECRTAFAYSLPDALASLEDVAKRIRARKELTL